jgi:hypothetical protein
MWSPPDAPWGWLMPVNGWYRLVRGTFARFGLPVPHPEQVVDTVMAHGRGRRWFAGDDWDACNVLDVVHPLWLCSRQLEASGRVPYRDTEVRGVAGELLSRISGSWVPGQGFAFAAGEEPGLQGTEMWLSVSWLLADLLGESGGLSFRPRGVHRPDAPGAAALAALRPPGPDR